MSVYVMNWVMEKSPVIGAERLVLLVIAAHANDEGRNAFPSLTRIAAHANVDKRTAQRAVKALALSGAIAIAANAGPHGVHRYRVTLPKGWRDTTPRGVTPPATGQGDETPPGVADDPQGGGISSPKGWRDATQTVSEPSVNRPTDENSVEDRYETLRAVPDSKPPKCSAHPKGDGGTACGGCRKVREWDERADNERRAADRARLAACQDCEGMGFILDDSKLPTGRKCDHRRAAS